MNNFVALPAQGRRVHMYGTLSRLANPVGRAETTRENEVATMIRPVGPLRALGRWRWWRLPPRRSRSPRAALTPVAERRCTSRRHPAPRLAARALPLAVR